MRTVAGQPWLNPRTKQPMTGLGFTCAACHTGRFTYRGTTILVEGGPALTDRSRQVPARTWYIGFIYEALFQPLC
jgi:hypothetical protein